MELRDRAALEMEQKAAALEAARADRQRCPRSREARSRGSRAPHGAGAGPRHRGGAIARVDANPVDSEQVAGEAERLVTWQGQLAALKRRVRIYEKTLAAIEASESGTMRKATRFLEQQVGRDISRLTGGRYKRVEHRRPHAGHRGLGAGTRRLGSGVSAEQGHDRPGVPGGAHRPGQAGHPGPADRPSSSTTRSSPSTTPVPPAPRCCCASSRRTSRSSTSPARTDTTVSPTRSSSCPGRVRARRRPPARLRRVRRHRRAPGRTARRLRQAPLRLRPPHRPWRRSRRCSIRFRPTAARGLASSLLAEAQASAADIAAAAAEEAEVQVSVEDEEDPADTDGRDPSPCCRRRVAAPTRTRRAGLDMAGEIPDGLAIEQVWVIEA